MITYSYLALGDSYSIGEQVAFADNFPNQTVQLLRKDGFGFYAPEIIAKTGWTTDELNDAIENTALLETYDIVSLLIGVNNQYRGSDINKYREQIRFLVSKSIEYAGNAPNRVVVLSIPDRGVTPFASSRDREQIAKDIDAFNFVNREE